MFKRAERKRKRREEEEESSLDEDMMQVISLNDTDSDESDSPSERESAQSGLGSGIGEDSDQDEDATTEDSDANTEPPISVEEALKDPIYPISLDPTVHGCILCKGKLIKNAVMATAHRNANVHMRRFEHFRLLCADADPRSNAQELIKIQSASSMQKAGSQKVSKRSLKRQAKQRAIREKRKQHKELKAKAMAKKASKKPPAAEQVGPVASPEADLRHFPESRNQAGKTRKKQKLKSSTSEKSTSHTKTSSDVPRSRIRKT